MTVQEFPYSKGTQVSLLTLATVLNIPESELGFKIKHVLKESHNYLYDGDMGFSKLKVYFDFVSRDLINLSNSIIQIVSFE